MSPASAPGAVVDAARCPLCAGPNQCDLAAPTERKTPPTCWCMHVRVNRTVLARLSPEQRDRACLCHACATQPEVSG